MNIIQVNKEKMIETLFTEIYNREHHTLGNGEWQVHVFPSKFVQMESDTIVVKPFFHQSGNFYGNNVGHVCEFSIMQFFDWEGDLSQQDFTFEALDEEDGEKYTTEKICSSLKDQIVCEDAEGTVLHSYKIEWI